MYYTDLLPNPQMYDDDWFGNDVTVVEMDGEIDMDSMEEILGKGPPSSSMTEYHEKPNALRARCPCDLPSGCFHIKEGREKVWFSGACLKGSRGRSGVYRVQSPQILEAGGYWVAHDQFEFTFGVVLEMWA